jgi:hypothetical protein
MRRSGQSVNGTPVKPGKQYAATGSAPVGFIAAPREVFGFAAWTGPCEGRVTTTWNPCESILIHLEEPEDLNRAQANSCWRRVEGAGTAQG